AQWAGPHSRTYGNWLGGEAAAYLGAQTGMMIVPHPNAPGKGHGEFSLVPPLPCPARYREAFRARPEQHSITRRFIVRADDRQSTYGTTWMDDIACLGSVNWDSLWTQRRPLLAYWRTPADPAAMLRLRFLHDGQDFATAGVRVAQSGPRALAIVGLLTNRGDFHLHLDRPADGRFPADDLRVRLELRALGAQARQLGEHLFELAAGERRAVIHAMPSQFGATTVRWQLAEIDGGVALDGLCNQAPTLLDPAATVTQIVLGIELLSPNEAPSEPPHVEVQDGRIDARWGNEIELAAPIAAETYPA
ncbi:MAG TPA: hypothetical protein VFT99_18090, partial [Roseiflexaceae bacterium]|nr:hypothetical protein [Roseiflexaceae bacterium]